MGGCRGRFGPSARSSGSQGASRASPGFGGGACIGIVGPGACLGCGSSSWGLVHVVCGMVVLALALVLSLGRLPSGAIAALVGLYPTPGSRGYEVGNDAVIAAREFAPALVPVEAGSECFNLHRLPDAVAVPVLLSVQNGDTAGCEIVVLAVRVFLDC